MLGARPLALPDLGPSAAAAWVLPALALALGALALGTWLRVEVAVGVLTGRVAGGRCGRVWWLDGHDVADRRLRHLRRSPASSTALAAALAAAAVVVVARRDRFATLEVFR